MASQPTTMVQKSVTEWEARLAELQPLMAEASELEKALAGVRSNVDLNSTPTAAPKAKTKRNNGSANRAPRGSVKEQFLALIEAEPGIKVADAAKRMEKGPNYLYKLAGDLVKSGTLAKDGNGVYTVVKSEDE